MNACLLLLLSASRNFDYVGESGGAKRERMGGRFLVALRLGLLGSRWRTKPPEVLTTRFFCSRVHLGQRAAVRTGAVGGAMSLVGLERCGEVGALARLGFPCAGWASRLPGENGQDMNLRV